MITLRRNKLSRFFLSIIAVLFIFSCQKEFSSQDGGGNANNPDLVTKVTSSVSGFVTDENDAPVMGSLVSAGGNSVSTDKYGFFEIRNVQVVKNAAMVIATKAGYFKGIKTYLAENNKAAFFRIKLIPKSISGTITASTGGNITLTNGLMIALPANAVVNATTNANYSGTINVAAHWIDPSSADLQSIMPGDLRGIDQSGALKRLTTYGMTAVELTGSSGELLQIAPGKKASITLPIPASLVASAAPSIPLWSFDESNGLWKEEGQATKTGNSYVGEVSHFSFWNCDVPNNYVQFNCTLKDAAGNGIPWTIVKISVVGGGPYNARFGYTDSSGYVGGAIPDNAQLLLEVFTNYYCGTPVYTQNFSTTSSNVSLGIITINSTLLQATVSGTVTNCNNLPVTNGYIIMLENNQYFRYPISNTGSFNFSSILCNSSANVTFIAEDQISQQQSAALNQTLVAGSNNIGNLQACGSSINEFITYSVDGATATTLSAPADSLFHQGAGTTTSVYIGGSNNAGSGFYFNMDNTGIGLGTMQNLLGLSSSAIPTQTTIPSPIGVNITEYGPVGQFIAGNFSGTVQSSSAPITNYVVTCSFRVRRTF